MYSLVFSQAVVAAIIPDLARAPGTDLNALAASEGAPSADTRADHRVRLVDEENQIRMLLQLPDDVLHPVFEHATQHRARDHGVHLQIDDLAVAQTNRHRFRVELDATRQPLDDRRLPDARLADEHHRVGALPVAEHLEHLVDLTVAAEHGRHLVLPRQQIKIRREVLQERRKLEALLEPLFPELQVARAGRRSG